MVKLLIILKLAAGALLSGPRRNTSSHSDDKTRRHITRRNPSPPHPDDKTCLHIPPGGLSRYAGTPLVEERVVRRVDGVDVVPDVLPRGGGHVRWQWISRCNVFPGKCAQAFFISYHWGVGLVPPPWQVVGSAGLRWYSRFLTFPWLALGKAGHVIMYYTRYEEVDE